jgi:hypothetical protein
MYELGKADAKQYYRGGGAFALGALTAPTLIGPLIVAAVPVSPYSKHNPYLQQYMDHPDYMRGYRKKAQSKKVANALLGMTLFWFLLLGSVS